MKVGMIEFANPMLLWALLLLPLLAVWHFLYREKKIAAIHLSSYSQLFKSGEAFSFWSIARHFPFLLFLLGLGTLIVALARPQGHFSFTENKTEGIDIVITLDISTSMLAEDFKPNRLSASKVMAKKFIDSRPNDRIGLVVYAGESFTQCPLTSDHKVLKGLFKGIEPGIITDMTAIGLGLATSVNRLKDSEASSKVVILLTDGVNNFGDVEPKMAAELAQSLGIRVYTIGVGSKGNVNRPGLSGWLRPRMLSDQIDEKTLKEIASITGGNYYRATDNKSLEKIYGEIDQLEKTKINSIKHIKRPDRFFGFVLIGGCLLIASFLFQYTLFRSIN